MKNIDEFVMIGNLRDSPLSNTKYTWLNGHNNPTMSRLDRFLVLGDWEDVYPNYIQEVLLRLTSDH